MLTLSLDRDGHQPLYKQLKGHITHQIETGILLPDARLPSTRDLADQLGIARISVINAYEELKDEGYIVSQVGRGTFVASAHSSTIATHAAPFTRNAALRRLMHMAERPDVINFATGAPPDSFLPVDMIRQSINKVLAQDGASAIAYEAPEGNADLRRAIAALVAKMGITAGNVLITGGCQQALDLVVQALLTPGDTVLTSTPTYSGFLDIAQARSIQPVGVPVDNFGMQTDMLEAIIAEHSPRLIYVAPTYHNPTGTVMPQHRREALLHIAHTYNIPILEDGVYQDLTYLGSPPLPLKALDDQDIVLHASSFSKIMLPGMRIGYLLVGNRLYDQITRVKQAADVCTPALNQRVIHQALQAGTFERHLEKVRADCLTRRSAVLDAVTRFLPDAAWHEPGGGLYLWLELPADGPTATDLFIQAVRYGAAFAPGPLFYMAEGGEHHLRINMAAYPPEQSAEGIARLGQAWTDMHHAQSRGGTPFL